MDDCRQNCRLCFQRFRRGKKMFLGDETFQEKLRVVFQFAVLLEENLSNEVCRACTMQIDTFYMYSMQVRSNQSSVLSLQFHCTNVSDHFGALASPKQEPCEDEPREEEMHYEEIEIKNFNLMSTPEDVATSLFDEYSSSLESIAPSVAESTVNIDVSMKDETELLKPTNGDQKQIPSKRSAPREADTRLRDSFHLGCEMCPFLSETFRDLYIHYRIKHNTTGYIRCCDRKFRRRSLALEHVDAHSGTIRCNICDRSFTTYYALKLHTTNRHGKPDAKPFKCDHCHRTFCKQYKLNMHLKIHTEHKVRCTICDKNLSTANALKVHMEKMHGTHSKLICASCGKELSSKVAMVRHMNDHMGIDTIDRVQCEMCKTWINGKYNLKTHMRRMHFDTGPFECDVCKHVSPNRFSLKKHTERMHVRGKPFECERCGKQFRTKLNLREHMATHTGIPLYSCAFCSVTFNSIANRYTHHKAKHPIEWNAQKQLKVLQKNGKTLGTS